MKGKQVSKVPYFLHKAICCNKTLNIYLYIELLCSLKSHFCRTQNEMFWRMFKLIKKELIQSLLDFYCMEENSLDSFCITLKKKVMDLEQHEGE